MTYAPDDLKAVQRYCHEQTGQEWASLGITHQQPDGGGYHEGHDLLHAAGRAPEDSGSDYSYVESPRDRHGLTDAGSAFDLGDDFKRFREVTLGIVAACERNDPRTRDIREVIYTPDGRTVRRWDALGRRGGGDDSHLTHTHISFFRDSEGRRANHDNFLGLLVELFEGRTESEEVDLNGDQDSRLRWVDGRAASLADMTDNYVDPAGKPHTNQLVIAVKTMRADLAAVKASESASLAAVQALTATINKLATGTGGQLDAAPIVAAIQAAGDKESATVAALTKQVADLTSRLAAAAQAEATALKQS